MGTFTGYGLMKNKLKKIIIYTILKHNHKQTIPIQTLLAHLIRIQQYIIQIHTQNKQIPIRISVIQTHIQRLTHTQTNIPDY